MVILIVEKVSLTMRGMLCRWMIEPKAGVFVGKLSATVRDYLWDKFCANLVSGAAVMIHSHNNEQGFLVRSVGDRDRVPVDFDGVTLIRRLNKTTKKDEVK